MHHPLRSLSIYIYTFSASINPPISSAAPSQAGMEQPKALFAIAAVLGLLELSAAANYTVGAPGGGWDLKTNLASWASAITFKTGDNLIFSYSPSSHNVVEVSKANYDSCTATSAIKTYTTGDDRIPLTAEGKRYFICGFPGHCSGGMKVAIDTTSASGSPPPSGSPSTPTPPAASSPPIPPPPPPPPSAATRLGFGGKVVVGGMLMVLAL